MCSPAVAAPMLTLQEASVLHRSGVPFAAQSLYSCLGLCACLEPLFLLGATAYLRAGTETTWLPMLQASPLTSRG